MQERTTANSRPEHGILTTLKVYTSGIGVVLDKRENRTSRFEANILFGRFGVLRVNRLSPLRSQEKAAVGICRLPGVGSTSLVQE